MDMKTQLQEVIKEVMSPQAVALIVAHLQTVSGDSKAAKEAYWFSDLLTETVGGPDALNDLFEEVGV